MVVASNGQEPSRREGACVVIDVDAVSSWLADLLAYLDVYHDVLLDWATGPIRTDAANYDGAIYGLGETS